MGSLTLTSATYARARIEVDTRRLFLGYHDSEERAAAAYDEAALHHFGEFARTNGG